MAIKCSALFQLSTNPSGGSLGGPRLAGWSEQWWSTANLQDTRIAFNRLCNERAWLLPRSAVIVGQRYQLDTGGSSTDTRRFKGALGRETDIPQAALLCSVRIGNRPNIRRFTLRGFPDIWIEEGELKPNAQFNARWSAFKEAVQEGPFGWLMRDMSQPTVRIATVIAGAVVLQADLNLAVGDYMQIRDCRDQFRQSMGGRYQVLTKTDNQHYTVRGWPVGSEVSLNGFATKYAQVVDDVNTEVDYVRIVSRKVGRPFEQYRGRSSRRR